MSRRQGKKKKAPVVPEVVVIKPSMKPHKRLFVGLFIAFGAWVVFLLVLYFQTVYPIRHR
jgi:hypothetical protein